MPTVAPMWNNGKIEHLKEWNNWTNGACGPRGRRYNKNNRRRQGGARGKGGGAAAHNANNKHDKLILDVDNNSRKRDLFCSASEVTTAPG